MIDQGKVQKHVEKAFEAYDEGYPSVATEILDLLDEEEIEYAKTIIQARAAATKKPPSEKTRERRPPKTRSAPPKKKHGPLYNFFFRE